MNYKIDKNLPSETTEVLASAGFGCDSVSDGGLAGAEDTAVAEAIVHEGRVLITLDNDFAPRHYPRIIVLRPQA